MSDTTAILIAVVLLAGNAFFVGAEFALISARRSQIEPLAEAGSRRARSTLRAMENVSLMMACAQLGITACSLGLGAIGEPAVAHLIERPLDAAGVPGALLHPIAFTIAMSIVIFLHMVLGEMVPKNIAIAGPERSALWLGPPLAMVVVVLKPLILALNGMANGVLRLLRVEPRDEVASTFTAEEVAGLIAESRREGLLDHQEHELLSGALEFDEQPVSSVLLPRASLTTVPIGVTPVELQQACARTGFSRFPVAGTGGDLVGYLHVKDVLTRDPAVRTAPVPERLIRPLSPVGVNDHLHTALSVMRGEGAHLARVTDADGTEVGVVALEDILEELVGVVRDAAQDASREVTPTRG